jgi:hypothetical protein
MNKLVLATLVSLAASAASAHHSEHSSQSRESALAQGDVRNASTPGPAYALYRRVVLGDASVAIAPAAHAMEDSTGAVPGSYAAYLMNNGLSKIEAIAQARRIGERPGTVAYASRALPSQLTPYERYLRAVVGWSDEEVLRGRAGALSNHADAGLVSNAAD